MPGTFSQIYIQYVFAVKGGRILFKKILKKRFISISLALSKAKNKNLLQ
jgi:hypothetical protein